MYFGGIKIMKQSKKKEDYSFEYLYDKDKKSKNNKKMIRKVTSTIKIISPQQKIYMKKL
jgi:hypothetical protein